MKVAILILVIVTIGLGGVVFLRQKQVVTAQEEAGTLSRQLADVRAILTAQQNVAAQQASNLLTTLERRTNELANLSNQLRQANLALAREQEHARAGQSELRIQAARVGDLERRFDEAHRQLEVVSTLQKELEESKGKLEQLSGHRESLAQENTYLRIEQAGILRKLQDLNFLRAQTAKVEEVLEARGRLAKQGPRAFDPRSHLELQEDGSVKLVSITNEVVRP